MWEPPLAVLLSRWRYVFWHEALLFRCIVFFLAEINAWSSSDSLRAGRQYTDNSRPRLSLSLTADGLVLSKDVSEAASHTGCALREMIGSFHLRSVRADFFLGQPGHRFSHCRAWLVGNGIYCFELNEEEEAISMLLFQGHILFIDALMSSKRVFHVHVSVLHWSFLCCMFFSAWNMSW